MRRVGHAFIADTARVIGEVELGAGVNIWYGVAIRGDVAKIAIGEGSNVQDNAVIHCDYGQPNLIGRNVSIGHGALCHGERIGDGCLIGMGAILLGRSRIGAGCMVAAGAVVPPGMEVPDGMLVMGVPGKIVRPVNEKEKEYLVTIPPRYVEMAALHASGKTDPRIKPWDGA
ncbi:MAG: gamma carbonic anhydrase family protein [Planctomycetes bacterium]|nr:gamma carbonic anhydrase family protein [Planctomycetota bacterium]